MKITLSIGLLIGVLKIENGKTITLNRHHHYHHQNHGANWDEDG